MTKLVTEICSFTFSFNFSIPKVEGDGIKDSIYYYIAVKSPFAISAVIATGLTIGAISKIHFHLQFIKVDKYLTSQSFKKER